MGSLSNSEQECIESIIEYADDTFGFDSKNALTVALVCLGERDGCLVGGSRDDISFLKDLFIEHNIPYVEDSSVGSLYVAKSESHLSQYNPLGGDKKVGRFLGYPEEAIEFYITSSDPLTEYDEFVEDSARKDVTRDLFLIDYIPKPTNESISEAKKRQSQYERALKSSTVDFSGIYGI